MGTNEPDCFSQFLAGQAVANNTANHTLVMRLGVVGANA
jgi:hypothetical protein